MTSTAYSKKKGPLQKKVPLKRHNCRMKCINISKISIISFLKQKLSTRKHKKKNIPLKETQLSNKVARPIGIREDEHHVFQKKGPRFRKYFTKESPTKETQLPNEVH